MPSEPEREIRVGEWRFVRTQARLDDGDLFPVTLAYDPAYPFHAPSPGCRAVDVLFDALAEREAAALAGPGAEAGAWIEWVAAVRLKFRLDEATGNKTYWDGYRAAIDDVERRAAEDAALSRSETT